MTVDTTFSPSCEFDIINTTVLIVIGTVVSIESSRFIMSFFELQLLSGSMILLIKSLD